MHPIAAEIQRLGIVGAGGAGFPAHVKLAAKAETVIVNAAECEPLIHKDKEILTHHAADVLVGLRLAMEAVSAKEGIIGIKAKHGELIARLSDHLPDGVKVAPLGDFYPAGDEITLIYETTGKVVEAGKLPLSQDVIVSNVETLLNIGRRKPVTTSFVTLGGEVEKRVTVEVPIGMPIPDLIEFARPSIGEYAVLLGGPMMGRLADVTAEVVTKTSSAVIVLPLDHLLVRRRQAMDNPVMVRRIGKAACDQCVFCTALCPRHLLGHPIEPHRAMRALMFGSAQESHAETHALACCECNLCSLVSCPEGLYPGSVSVLGKRAAIAASMRMNGAGRAPHPLIKYRRTPTKKLKRMLDLNRFGDSSPLITANFAPTRLFVPLRQHIGKAAEPVVAVGDRVEAGARIASVGKELGSEIHAPLAGVVVNCNGQHVELAVS